MSEAFFVPLGGGRFRATERTSGPWDPKHQHAGPPAALLLGLLERESPREEMVIARLTVEILGAVPISEFEASTVVAIDVTRLTYVDATAFPLLFRWARRTAADGRPAVVRGDSRYFDQMLETMGQAALFLRER